MSSPFRPVPTSISSPDRVWTSRAKQTVSAKVYSWVAMWTGSYSTLAGTSQPACSDAESTSANGESAATAASESGTVTVEDNFGTQEIALPVEKVASTDNRTFEILNEWGIDLVAAPKQLVPF